MNTVKGQIFLFLLREKSFIILVQLLSKIKLEFGLYILDYIYNNIVFI